jgi:hypothetical protein
MEGRNSPARSTTPKLNDGEGVAFLVWEAAPKLKEAPGPMQRTVVVDIVHGRGSFYRGKHRDRRDITDGRTRAWGKGTARRCAEAEHAHTVRTAARAPTAAASREGYAEWSLSIRRCLG